MAETKNCKQCGEQFEITEEELEFLKKISPTFAGKTFEIPSPTFCPDCRTQRRMAWRNERSLYKRKCDKTEEEIVSIYSPDKPYKVYKNSVWTSDAWNPLEFARDIDTNRSFFEQFNELMLAVPRKAGNTTMIENSDFCNQVWHTKDSYLCFNSGYLENCYYCSTLFHSRDCIDSYDIKNSEDCYFCFNCDNCNNSSFLESCRNCSESHYSYDCQSCTNVFLSSGLRNKQYYIENKSYSKEEYLEKIKSFDSGKRSAVSTVKERFNEVKKQAVHKENNNFQVEECTGDYLIQCKNCTNCYNAYTSENCSNVINIDEKGKECRDCGFLAEAELAYEGISIAGYKNLFSAFIPGGRDNLYCNFLDNCNNCFGCVGLTHKEYCILNKQYTKEEYEQNAVQIIEKMIERGEWGEFFPMSLSPFGYNETMANLFLSKTKESSAALGAKWQDNDYSLKYDGSFYEPKDGIEDYIDDEGERQALLNGILKCEISGKAFKIIPQELAFYLKNRYPIPTKHPEERYLELFGLHNPLKLYHRQCMCEQEGHDHSGRCPNEFKTTYAPDRPEKVYCELCYQKEII